MDTITQLFLITNFSTPLNISQRFFRKSVSFDRCCPTRLAYFQASIFHNINERISSVRKWMSKVRVTFHGKWRDKKRRPRLAALLFFLFLFTPFCFFPVRRFLSNFLPPPSFFFFLSKKIIVSNSCKKEFNYLLPLNFVIVSCDLT